MIGCLAPRVTCSKDGIEDDEAMRLTDACFFAYIWRMCGLACSKDTLIFRVNKLRH